MAVVPAEDAGRTLDAMRSHPLGRDAAIVGRVTAEEPGIVILNSRIGGRRVVTLLAGEQLPRIC
jgi:hydrogenase expression/formation protein HypE